MMLLRILIFVTCANLMLAGSKVAPDIQQKGISNSSIRVLVQFKDIPTKNQLKQLGAYGQLKKVFNSIKTAHVMLSYDKIQQLASDPAIVYISPDRPTKDEYGHGTHVAGIIGANGSQSTGVGFTRTFRGIAPAVNLINLRVLDAN